MECYVPNNPQYGLCPLGCGRCADQHGDFHECCQPEQGCCDGSLADLAEPLEPCALDVADWPPDEMGSFSLPPLELEPLPALLPFSPCGQYSRGADCRERGGGGEAADVLLSLKHAVIHSDGPADSHPQMMLNPGGSYPYYEHYAPGPLFPAMSVNVSMNMTMHGCPPDQLCPQVQWNQNSASPSVNVVYPQSPSVISPTYPSATYSFTADFRTQPDPLITASNFKPQPPKNQGYYHKQNYQKVVTPLKRSPSKVFDQKMDYGMQMQEDYGYACVAAGGKVQVGALSGCSEDDEHKPNLCRICGKTYARPSTLKTHLRTHSGERPYRCGDCHKSFSQAANLTAHVRTHTGQKPFRCPICDRRFSQSSSVTTHMRTHSGERPYQCRSCKKAFSDSSTLTKHLRIHSGEKPYQCKLCLLRFSQSGNLNRHMRVHGSAPGALG